MSIRNDLLERILTSVQNSGGSGASTVVNTINDFPGGFDADFVYIGSASVNESYILGGNLDMQGRTFSQLAGSTVTVRADSVLGYTISTSATAPLFSADQPGLVVRDIGLDCPNGSFFNFTKTSGFGFVIFKDVNFKRCDSFGLVSDLNYLSIESRYATTISGASGISFAGSIGVLIVRGIEVNSFAGTLVDFGTAVFEQYEVSGLKARTTAGNILLNALPNDGNLAANGYGLIFNNSDLDGLSDVVGITPKDVRTRLYGNLNLPDSFTVGDASIIDNSPPATSILDGTYSDINGVATYDPDRNSRFIQSGDNGLEAKNVTPTVGICTAVISASKSGASQLYDFAVLVDQGAGFQLAGSPSRVEIKNTVTPTPITAVVSVADGVKHKVAVSGVGTTDSIEVSALSLIVKA